MACSAPIQDGARYWPVARACFVDVRRWPSTLDSTAGFRRRAHISELNCRQSSRERTRAGVDRPTTYLNVLPQQTEEAIQRTACRSTHRRDRKSTRLNSSHSQISYAVFCLKKKKKKNSEKPDNKQRKM